MLAVAGLLVQVTRESRTAEADARLAEGLETSLTIYRDELRVGRREARRAARDARLIDAIRRENSGAVRDHARRILRRERIDAIVVRDADRRLIARAGASQTVASSRLLLEGSEGPIGSLRVSPVSAERFLRRVRRLTNRHAVLASDGSVVASTVDLGRQTVPISGSLELADGEHRIRSVVVRDAEGEPVRLGLLSPLEAEGLTGNQTLVAIFLAGFFVVAFGFAVLLVRALQGQVREMLGAAQRIGEGDFGHKVPVEGRDEMAGLADEFNKMSDRLSDHVAELRSQREKLQESIRRVGDAFASGLDRDALLGIVVDAAVDACNADFGRAALGEERLVRAQSGEAPEGAAELIDRVERDAIRLRAAAEAEVDGSYVIAHPLLVASERGGRRCAGVMTIYRSNGAFTPSQREMFNYLSNQAIVSMENVELHELVARQAVTDELTGLSNHRRFQEVMGAEVERATRFHQDLGLIMLDIDDFKAINDTYGHQQGDEVLREVAAVLRRESREIDEPSRYGGEEMAIALPQTDTAGAHRLAERMRTAIESTEIEFIDGSGSMRVTASFGVAAIPASASSAAELISAADTALYEAKRTGKNRTVSAAESTTAGNASPAT